ncbi:MAG: hypothetical protein L0191_11370, partial [Acidobacteria bacterium]|nr:hypothetical protein [Acidobacteriota bacterium]
MSGQPEEESGKATDVTLRVAKDRPDNQPSSPSPLTPHRSPTLVIQTAFPGDVVLTIPLLQRLAERHGAVDVVTTPGTAPLLEAHPAVRQVVRYD